MLSHTSSTVKQMSTRHNDTVTWVTIPLIAFLTPVSFQRSLIQIQLLFSAFAHIHLVVANSPSFAAWKNLLLTWQGWTLFHVLPQLDLFSACSVVLRATSSLLLAQKPVLLTWGAESEESSSVTAFQRLLFQFYRMTADLLKTQRIQWGA